MRSVWLVALAGCLDAGAVECPNSEVCPSGTFCVMLSADDNVCATQDQLTACVGQVDGAECTVPGGPPGSCVGGACLPIECGNARVEPGETCDDRNTQTGDGTCSADCLSNETCGNSITDPVRFEKQMINGVEVNVSLPNEQCDDGNLLSGDGCSGTCALEAPRWSMVSGPIESLDEYAVAYDSGRQRIVYVGGSVYDPVTGERSDNRDVWEWNGSGWLISRPAISPEPRDHAMIAYDAARKRIVLFGGSADGSTGYGDTWEWDGEQWTLRVPMHAPPPRGFGGMVYDAARKKIVLFGGSTGRVALNDIWEWDGTDWSEVTPAGVKPAARFAFVMGYDPKRATIVVAGGSSNVDAPVPVLDTWELANGMWKQITTAPCPAELAGIGSNTGTRSGMAYDQTNAASPRFIAYATTGALGTTKTLAYNGVSWTNLNTATPGTLSGIELVTDPTTNFIYMFGGYDDTGIGGPPPNKVMWKWTGTVWVDAKPFDPTMLNLSATANDPVHRRAWVFGGQDAADAPSSELASFDGSRWTRYTVSGPSARYAAQVAYDRKNDRLVVFGGKAATGSPLADTWLFDGTSWSNPTPATSPPGRLGGMMTYDSRRERVVLFGGLGTTQLADTWEWDGTTWTQVTTANAPEGRALSEGTFDEQRGVVVLAHGFRQSDQLIFNDTWTYDGTNWTLVQSPTPQVTRAFSQTLAYDAVARSCALFGGFAPGGVPLGDTWSWNGTWNQTLVTAAAPPRGYAVAFSAPGSAGVMIHSGTFDIDGGPKFGDTWRLRFENNEPRENCHVTMDNDGDGLQGCADPDCWGTCTPGCVPGTTCIPNLPRCGDGTCSAIENCRICPDDCPCTAACGDSFCDTPETSTTCPGDCP